MTIKTLEFIHRLLVAEEAKTKKAYRDAESLWPGYVENGAVSRDFIEKQDECAKAHTAAANALEDFESRDW